MPGFRFSVASYVVSLLRPEVIRELELPKFGLDILPLDGTFTPLRKGDGPERRGGGDYLWRVNDHGRTVRELRRWSKSRTPRRTRSTASSWSRWPGSSSRSWASSRPTRPSIDPRPMLPLAEPGPEVRPAARAPAGGVRPADDDVGRRLPRPVVRDRPAQGDDVGVRDHRHLPGHPLARARRTCCSTTTWARSTAPSARGASPRAAPAACRTRSPARPRRSARRSGPRRRSRGSSSRNGRATGVVLESGEEIEAASVLSSADAKVTFLDLLEDGTLDPEFEQEVRRFKFRGSSGKVNLAVDRAAGLHVPARRRRAPARRDQLQPVDGGDGAGLRRREVRPLEPQAVHRHDHPDAGRSPDGPARQARHQLLRPVRAVPARPEPRAPGTTTGRRSATRSSTGSPSSRPNIRDIIVGRQVLTPLDIERTIGLTEGNIFQGELSPRAAVLQPAGPGLRAVPHADPRPVAVGLVDAPGRRPDGRQRPARGARGPQVPRPEGGLTWRRRPTRYDAIVVGAGHNGLTAAAYLATGGLRVLVLEARDRIGGATVTEELAPGVRVPSLAHTVGRLRPSVARELGLTKHGLSLVSPEVRVFAPQPDGRAVSLWGDLAASVDALARLVRRRRDLVRRVRPPRARPGAVPGRPRRRGAARDPDAGLRRRAPGPAAGPRVPRPRQGRRPHDPARARRGGRRLRRGVVRDAGGPGDPRLARRPLHGDGPLVRGHDRGAARGRRPATTAGRRARRSSPVAVRRRSPTRWPRRRGRPGAEIRTGARVASVIAVDGVATGVVLEGGEEIEAPGDRRRASTRSAC